MNNEPAFPEAGMSGLPNGDVVYGRSGMSLLDYFAAKAMQANVAKWSEIHRPSQIANDSYIMAEAMMEERKRRLDGENE